MLFILRSDPLLRRKPDVAFVSGERWPVRQPPPRGEAAWNVIPDLVVEVISPTDLASEVQGKVAEYLAAGVRLVWVVHPEQMEIYEYRTPRSVRVFGQDDAVDGGDVVPGFRMDLNEVFEVASTATIADEP